MSTITDIKTLREETGAGILEVKQALEDSGGDISKARAVLLAKSSAKAAKKADRTAGDGLIYSYIHNGGKMGSLVHVACETDFVAKTEDFKKLTHEIALQVCTDAYESVEALLASEYMRDASKTIQDIINDTVAKTGEKIELRRFVKYSINE